MTSSSSSSSFYKYYRKLSNFTLFACFHEATMVGVTNKPVEFELSMGKWLINCKTNWFRVKNVGGNQIHCLLATKN